MENNLLGSEDSDAAEKYDGDENCPVTAYRSLGALLNVPSINHRKLPLAFLDLILQVEKKALNKNKRDKAWKQYSIHTVPIKYLCPDYLPKASHSTHVSR